LTERYSTYPAAARDQISLDHRPAQLAQPDTDGTHPAIQVRDEAHMLPGRGPRVTLPKQILGEPDDVRLQRPRHERPQHLDHDALLSTMENQASNRSPDYADLASPKPQSCKAIHDHIGIIRRSA
jgi:hypothetical protein